MQQLEKIRQEADLEQKEFDALLGTKNLYTRWKHGRSQIPKLEKVLLIAEKFNKSLDWLLFAQEAQPLSQISEFADTYESQTPAPVDTELIAEVVRTVEIFLEKHRLKISAQRKGRFVSMIYEHCITEKVSPNTVNLRAYLILA